ncbi:MAG: bestrophin family ion channel [Spirosomataceae bacterium]
MHAGKRYSTAELLLWTRKNILKFVILSGVPVLLYEYLDLQWLALPWTVVALLGTATAFIVGFKNTQTYNRTWEARQIWGGILNSSRAWGIMARDFLDNPQQTQLLVYRHFAWLTALRYAMRDSRTWEAQSMQHNIEYQSAHYTIPEKQTSLESELPKYLSDEELKYLLTTQNKAAQLLSLQSKTIKELYRNNRIDSVQFVEMQRALKELYDWQGRSERIKNFPYPRQFATINTVFIRIFCILLPFGMLKDFDKLNESATGFLQGHMIWFVVPFSVLICWMYTTLDQVGESTENPFEGSPNDVPISQMSRTIEIDLREMLGETELPPAIRPQNNIVL